MQDVECRDLGETFGKNHGRSLAQRIMQVGMTERCNAHETQSATLVYLAEGSNFEILVCVLLVVAEPAHPPVPLRN